MTYTTIERTLSRIAGMDPNTQYITSDGNVNDRCFFGRILTWIAKVPGMFWVRELILKPISSIDLQQSTQAVMQLLKQAEHETDSTLTSEQKATLRNKVIDTFNQILTKYNSRRDDAEKIGLLVSITTEDLSKKNNDDGVEEEQQSDSDVSTEGKKSEEEEVEVELEKKKKTSEVTTSGAAAAGTPPTPTTTPVISTTTPPESPSADMEIDDKNEEDGELAPTSGSMAPLSSASSTLPSVTIDLPKIDVTEEPEDATPKVTVDIQKKTPQEEENEDAPVKEPVVEKTAEQAAPPVQAAEKPIFKRRRKPQLGPNKKKDLTESLPPPAEKQQSTRYSLRDRSPTRLRDDRADGTERGGHASKGKTQSGSKAQMTGGSNLRQGKPSSSRNQ